MQKLSYITQEGLDRLKKELDKLVNFERPAISRQIAEARDKGDLSENAEYAAAKEAQGLLEMRIARLKDTIGGSRVIDESKIDTSRVQILTRVKLKNTRNDKVMEYMIVPDSEADLKAGKLSISTPIAKGLLGKKAGEVVEIKVPSGLMFFEIISISI